MGTNQRRGENLYEMRAYRKQSKRISNLINKQASQDMSIRRWNRSRQAKLQIQQHHIVSCCHNARSLKMISMFRCSQKQDDFDLILDIDDVGN
jgi:GH25 family lysozyme M1 (1,4-beta-N-acetylmuramidase)